MIKQLNEVSTSMLQQVSELIRQLTDDDYSRALDLLSGNTIAKHVRHVLEMYDEMLNGVEKEVIDYDARKRNLLIEHNREYTLQFIGELIVKLHVPESDKPLSLLVNYNTANESILVDTTLNREICYNIEHAIHHMAIIAICVRQSFHYIKLDQNFGVAFSTQNYLKQHVHAHIYTK
ncbi:MAG: DinB family protein [Bacteroidota bacterium]